MNSGPNQPSGSGNGGGRGRRRRRGRRGHGGQQGQGQGPGTQQPQGTQAQGGAPSEAGASQPRGGQPRSGRPHGGARRQSQPQDGGGQNRGQQQNRRGRKQQRSRGPVNQRTPDAGIYSAPMDHSYRHAMQDGNGNGNGGRVLRGEFREIPVDAISGNGSSKPIYAFVDDLFFLAKIQETARKLGVKVEFVKAEKEVLDGIIGLEEKPSLIIFDLNSNTSKPLTTIPKLKSKLKKETNFIGFLSHLQGELKMKAQEAGCDMVLPRSAFSQNLPQLLRRHAADDLQDELEA